MAGTGIGIESAAMWTGAMTFPVLLVLVQDPWFRVLMLSSLYPVMLYSITNSDAFKLKPKVIGLTVLLTLSIAALITKFDKKFKESIKTPATTTYGIGTYTAILAIFMISLSFFIYQFGSKNTNMRPNINIPAAL
jgi:hypothetical protein